eukprot:SAG11_NODE_1641_length_4530_cov_6.481607_5_plen_470_part_01
MGAYLDDAALTSHMRPLVMGAAAYMAEGSKKNWKFVSYKSILTADWYGPPLRSQRWHDCVEEEKEEGGQSSAATANGPSFSAHLAQGRPTSAELLPGVVITIAREGMTCREDAHDGQITLGVPIGTDAYVEGKVTQLIADGHDNRLRGLALLAGAHGDEVTRRDTNLALQLALHGLRLSANARSAHFLRNVPRRLVAGGIAAHDRGIQAAMAVALEQMPMPKGPLAAADLSEATQSFQTGWQRMTLHTAGRGLGMREWSNYSDAAYIGCWAQAWKVTQRQVGGKAICVFPALAKTLEEADMFRSARAFGWTHQIQVTDMAKSLHDAWEACVVAAQTAFPSEQERELPTCPANWLALTGGGNLAQLDACPDRMQRHVSRCINRTRAQEFSRRIAAADHYGAVAQAQRYRDAGDARCGDCYTATPWMETGEMDLSSFALKKTLVTRFALDVPLSMRAPRRCPCGQRIMLPTG